MSRCLIAAVVVSAFLFSGCGDDTDGSVRVPPVAAFERIHNETLLDLEVELGAGGAPYLEIHLDEALQDAIDVAVVEGTLQLTQNRPLYNVGSARIRVAAPQLTEIHHETSGHARIQGGQAAPIQLEAVGSGPLRACIDVPTIRATNIGSGTLALCLPEGAAPLDRVEFITDGSGRASWVGDALETALDLSGSGTVTLEGRSDHLFVEKDGSGTLNARDYTALVADITSEGSGPVEVFVEQHATVHIGGSGDVILWGEAEVDLTDTGTGSFVRR